MSPTDPLHRPQPLSMDAMMEVLAKPVFFMIAAGIVGMLGRLGMHSQPNARGWRQVRPGAMYWTGAILSAVLFFLMAYIWLFVGSKRVDAESQMRILFWLAIAFGLGAIICAVSIHSLLMSAVRWRGRIIAFTRGGGEVRVALDDVQAMRPSLSGVVVEFKGGERLCISPYAAGGADLLEKLGEVLARPKDALQQ